MSKKDRQHQHIQQPITTQLMNQPEQAPVTGGDPSSMGREARIQHLEAELAAAQKLAAQWESSFKEENGIRLDLSRALQGLRADVELIAKAARHGAPPEGFEPKTAEGKEALEQVVLLGSIAKDQRERATDADAKWTRAVEDRDRLANELQDAINQRKALHSDLMALEQTASGSAVRNIPQTDLGKSALAALDELLVALHKSNDAHLEGDALPATGWSSATARQLVEAVGPQPGLRASDVRALLLGDLLAQLLPHTGEVGRNETASDVLKRLVEKTRHLAARSSSLEDECTTLRAQQSEMSERMVKIQSAMVARRAPDADWIAVRDTIAGFLSGTGLGGYGIVRGVEALVKEWQGLRAFFSGAPLTAVAVRDDGAKGPVRERFSLLVLSWDGRAVKTQVVEGTRPWGDISPYLDSAVRKHLIPDAYR